MTGARSRGPAVVVGDLVLDLVARLPETLHRGSDNRGTVIPRQGGSAANTAAWLARLGVPVVFTGRVGRDPLGDALVGALEAEGVTARAVRDPAAATGVILALVDAGGERSLVISPGANHRLAPEDLPVRDLARAAVLHLTAYSFFWDTARDAARAAVALARRHGVPVSVDAASAALIREFGPRRLLDELAGATYLFCNGEEACALAGCRDPETALAELGRVFPVVGIKAGAAGCLCLAGGRRFHQPAVPVTAGAAETTGCGDAWNAGMLAGLRAGLEPEAAARLAVWVAAWVAGRPGAVPPGWTNRLRQAAWAYARGADADRSGEPAGAREEG